MTIKVGDRIPQTTLHYMAESRPAQISTDDVFAGKRVALFSVPGAFTPTCSNQHLPGFVKSAGALHAKGIDAIACVAVNDAFVMHAWGEAQGVGDKVQMLADGNGASAAALGVELDASTHGLGTRSRRFSMIVNDGVVEALNLEEGGGFEVSSAERLLDQA